MTNLIKRAGWYSLSTAYSIFIQIVLTIFLIQQLSLEDYGVVGLFLAFVAVLSVIVSLGSENAVARSVYEEDNQSNKEVVKASLFIIFFNTILSSVIIFLASQFYSINTYFVSLIIAAAFMQAIINIIQAQLQMRELASKFALISFIFNSLIGLITIISLKDLSFYGRLLAPSLSGLITIIFYIVFFNGKYLTLPSISGDFKYVKKVGLPLTPHAILGMLNSYGDRLVISLAGNPSLLGAYSILSQVLNILITAISTLNNAYLPWLYKKIRSGEVIPWHKYALLSLLVGLILSLTLWILEINLYVPSEYLEILIIGKYIGLCFTLDALYYILVGKLYFNKHSITISSITVIQTSLRLIIGIFYVTLFTPTLFGMFILYCFGALLRLIITYKHFRKL